VEWWRKYGVTEKEKILVKSVYEIESVAPDLYKTVVRDHELVKGRIKAWEGVYITSMRREASERKRWTVWMAVREFIQNAMDIADRYGGTFDFKFRDNTVYVYNSFGKASPEEAKVKLVHWEYGKSDKQCWERGWFGEGMKMASIALLGMNKHIYVFSYDVAYKPVLWRDRLVIVMGTVVEPKTSTEVFIFPVSWKEFYVEGPWGQRLLFEPDMATFQQLLEEYNGKLLGCVEYEGPECPVVKPSCVVDIPDRLYVRDVFVNYMSNICEKSRFTYNLWWVELDPNRNTVSNTTQLEDEIVKVLAHVGGALRKLVESFCMFNRKERIVDCRCHGYYECKVYFDPSIVPEDAQKRFVEYIAQVTGLSKERLAVLTEDETHKIDLVKHVGYIPVLVNAEWSGLIPEESVADEKLAEELLKTKEMASPIDERTLSLKLRGYVEFARVFARWIGLDDVKIKVVYGRSHYDTDLREVALSIDDLKTRPFQVIIHELAHAYGYKMFGEAPDVSTNFEHALTYVAGEALKFTLNKIYAVKRTMNGGFGAVYHTDDHPKTKLRKLLTNILEEIDRKYRAAPTIPPILLAGKIVDKLPLRLDNPPTYIVVVLRVVPGTIDLDRVETGTCVSFYAHRYTLEKYEEEVSKRAMKTFREMRSKADNKPIVVFVYNPEKDEYEILVKEPA